MLILLVALMCIGPPFLYQYIDKKEHQIKLKRYGNRKII